MAQQQLGKAPTRSADALRLQDLPGTTNVKFTASNTLPLVTVAAGGTLILSVSPVVAGNTLTAGESITIQPVGADLPGALNLAWWRVSDVNTVRVGLSVGANLAAGTTTLSWLVTAHR